MSLRYSRQTIFPHLGKEGQARLAQSRVALFGCGGLGTHLAEILTRAGIGFLHIIDRDIIEEHNLQRQGLFDELQAKERLPKAIAARAKLKKINSSVTIKASIADINYTNIDEFTDDIDLILDGSDNFALRYLINDIAIKKEIPWIYAGAIGSSIMTTTFIPKETPCFKCLFGAPPPQELVLTCDTGGILGPTLHIATGIQAVEAIKVLIGKYEKCNTKLLSVDIWDLTWAALPIAQNRECSACVKQQFDYLAGDNNVQSSMLCGQNAVQIIAPQKEAVDLQSLAERLQTLGKVEYTPFMLRFKGEKEITIFKDLRAIVHGTTDEKEARTLYAKYVGC